MGVVEDSGFESASEGRRPAGHDLLRAGRELGSDPLLLTQRELLAGRPGHAMTAARMKPRCTSDDMGCFEAALPSERPVPSLDYLRLRSCFWLLGPARATNRGIEFGLPRCGGLSGRTLSGSPPGTPGHFSPGFRSGHAPYP